MSAPRDRCVYFNDVVMGISKGPSFLKLKETIKAIYGERGQGMSTLFMYFIKSQLKY